MIPDFEWKLNLGWAVNFVTILSAAAVVTWWLMETRTIATNAQTAATVVASTLEKTTEKLDFRMVQVIDVLNAIKVAQAVETQRIADQDRRLNVLELRRP